MVGNPLSLSQAWAAIFPACVCMTQIVHRGSAHQHRYKGETAVLDLLDLELSKDLGVISQAQRVERSTCRARQP